MPPNPGDKTCRGCGALFLVRRHLTSPFHLTHARGPTPAAGDLLRQTLERAAKDTAFAAAVAAGLPALSAATPEPTDRSSGQPTITKEPTRTTTPSPEEEAIMDLLDDGAFLL